MANSDYSISGSSPLDTPRLFTAALSPTPLRPLTQSAAMTREVAAFCNDLALRLGCSADCVLVFDALDALASSDPLPMGGHLIHRTTREPALTITYTCNESLNLTTLDPTLIGIVTRVCREAHR